MMLWVAQGFGVGRIPVAPGDFDLLRTALQQLERWARDRHADAVCD
ncbi:MAG TPA: hypothetical protein VNT26_10765 [Candidatus Sulfotelmatobacter sp.]|nr:hypothetical protein [Candidatus Sulfotelmatobacter sp.]